MLDFIADGYRDRRIPTSGTGTCLRMLDARTRTLQFRPGILPRFGPNDEPDHVWHVRPTTDRKVDFQSAEQKAAASRAPLPSFLRIPRRIPETRLVRLGPRARISSACLAVESQSVFGPEPTVSPPPRCFDTNYMKSDTRDGRAQSPPPSCRGLTTRQRQERLMLSSASPVDPAFLQRNATLLVFYPLSSRRSSHSFVRL